MAMDETRTRPALASAAKPIPLTHADIVTLRMGLVEWQRSLQRKPELLATPDGLAEWERIGRLLEVLG